MGSSGTWILSAKVAALSAAALTAALLLGMSAPAILSFLSSEVPRMYGSLLSWLTPPYLYFVINGIIISIAASSRFHKSDGPDLAGSGSAPAAAPQPVPSPHFDPQGEEELRPEIEFFVEPEEEEAKPSEEVEAAPVAEPLAVEEEEFAISRSSWTPIRTESGEIPTEYSSSTERPPVSARLGRRKSIKASPEGRALGVARQRRGETLESTWKAITDGRPVPLARHLKKSDTWETHGKGAREEHVVRKSETFKERGGAGGRQAEAAASSPASPGGGPSAGKLRKEASLGQDDLNRRVEAFIKKFNEEMRLQRQESMMHYMDMINRGSN